jgi:hypothetical protein
MSSMPATAAAERELDRRQMAAVYNAVMEMNARGIKSHEETAVYRDGLRTTFAVMGKKLDDFMIKTDSELSALHEEVGGLKARVAILEGGRG